MFTYLDVNLCYTTAQGGNMDIAALSVVMHNSAIKQNASMAVMKKVMDLNKESIQKTLEMSLTPHIGANVDIRI